MLSVIYFAYFKILFCRVHIFLDEVNVTEDDYSIMVENIPTVIRSSPSNSFYTQEDLNVSIEEYLKQYFEIKFRT